MSCAYCKNIAVCAICGKGFGAALRADQVKERALEAVDRTNTLVNGLMESVYAYGKACADELPESKQSWLEDICERIEKVQQDAYAEGRKDEREEWMPIGGQHVTQAHHTPGPWFVTKRSDWNAICHVGRAWNISTTLPLSDFGHVDLDAQLIAAAPDLLRVAELVVSWLDEEPDAHKLCDAARAAISKATGSQP